LNPSCKVFYIWPAALLALDPEHKMPIVATMPCDKKMFFLNLNVTSRNCFLWAFLNKFDTAVGVYVLWNLSDSIEWFKWQYRIRERFECGEIEWKRGNTRKSLFPPHNRLQFYNAWSGSYLNDAQWKIWLLFFCKTRYPINSDTLDCEKLVKRCKIFVLAAGDFVTGEKIIGIIKNWW